MKRGELAQSTVVLLVLALIILAIFLSFLGRMDELGRDRGAKAVCKATVYKHAYSMIKDIDFSKDISCPTVIVDVDNKKEREIKEEVAKAMYDCWDQMGEGRLRLFSGDERKEKFCVICHILKFKEEKEISAASFDYYMRTTEIPGTTTKFRDFLWGYSTYDDSEHIQNIANTNININTRTDYATIFTYAKDDYMSKYLTGAIGGTTGLVTASVATLFIPGVGAFAAAGIITAGAVGGGFMGYGLGNDKVADWNASIWLMPYEPEYLAGIGCTEAPAGQEYDPQTQNI